MSNIAFEKFRPSSTADTASFSGVSNKTTFLLGLMLLSGFYAFTSMELTSALFWGVMIVTTIAAFTIIFKQNLAPLLSPVYALGEGVLLGVISKSLEVQFPGIVTSAIVGTVGLFALILTLYRLKIVRNSPAITKGIVFAMIGILIMRLFELFMGRSIFPEGGWMHLGIQCAIVGVATFSFVIDFDAVEDAVKHRASKSDEWYLAFGIMLSIVWLYMEVLRLLKHK